MDVRKIIFALKISTECSKDVLIALSNNEGTTAEGGTSPTISTGEANQYIDYGILGYGVGCDRNNPSAESVTLNKRNCCVPAYDIKGVFAGPSNSTIRSAIPLCMSLIYTCVFMCIIMRSKLIYSALQYVVRVSNASIGT